MTRLSISALVLLLGASTITPAMADLTTSTRSYSATAYSLDGEELLYVERHIEKWLDGKLSSREVTYEDADGELIAEKEVRYGADASIPSFEMTDFRTGLVESAQVGAQRVELFSGLATESEDSKLVTLPETAVIDAGFDAFMRNNFERILDDERLEFEFAVPAAQRFFRFRLQPRGRSTYGDREAVEITMKPANPLLRLLLDPISLTYDLEGRLLEFRGLSNVADPDGDRYKARIVFDYASTSHESSDRLAAR